MSDTETKKQWESMLRGMLEEFRKNNPSDQRDDKELLHSLMEHFAEQGLVKKENGKFVLGKIMYDS